MSQREIRKPKRVRRETKSYSRTKDKKISVSDLILKEICPNLDKLRELGVLSAQKRQIIGLMLKQSEDMWRERREK